MAQYVKKPEIVDVEQWNKVGDVSDAITALSVDEAKSGELCKTCGRPLSTHGEKDMAGITLKLCPGIYHVTREDGRVEHLTEKELNARYEVVKT